MPEQTPPAIPRPGRRSGRGGQRGSPNPVPGTLRVSIALGVVLGITWWLVADRPPTALTGAVSPGQRVPSQLLIARDGLFSMGALCLGLVHGVVVARHARDGRGLPSLLAAVCGGLLGSSIAWGLGRLLAGSGAYGTHLTLHAWSALLVWPFTVALTVFVWSLVVSVGDWRTPPAPTTHGRPETLGRSVADP